MSSLGRISRLLVSSRNVLAMRGRSLQYSATVKARMPAFIAREESLSLDQSHFGKHLTVAVNPGLDRKAMLGRPGRKMEISATRQLENLDNQVRQWGRVDKEQVYAVLRQLEREGQASENQALMLVRSTGKLMVKMAPETRHEIFTEIWQTLEKIGCPKTTSLYNAALRVQMENEQQFSATEFLEAMVPAAPNRVTYQLLIVRYCEEGDMEAALKILEHMKTNDMLISEMVFNALIKGYMQAGNQEAVNEILENMREGGMEPSADTYQTMMNYHASKGDVEAIKQVVSEAHRDEVVLHPRQFLELVPKMAANGHSGLIQEVMDLRPPNMPFNQDALNCIHQLVARGYDKDAIIIYKLIDTTHSTDSDGASRMAHNVIRTMVMAGRPVDYIEAMMKEFELMGHLQSDSSIIAMYALRYRQPNMALEIFPKLQEQGMPVRAHYFWPIFNEFKRDKNVPGMYEALGHLLNLVTDREKYATAYYNAIFKLTFMGEKWEDVLNKVKEIGYSAAYVNFINMLKIANEGKFEEAATLVKVKPFEAFPSLVRSELSAGFVQNPDHDALAKLMGQLSQSHQNYLLEANGHIIQEVFKSNKTDAATAEKFIEDLHKEHVRYHDQLQHLVSESAPSGISTKSKERLQSLAGMAVTTRPSTQNYMDMSIKELEALAEGETGNQLSIKKWLLSKYCGAGNVEAVERVKAELDAEEFKYGAELLRQLGYLSARYKEDLAEARLYRQQIEEQFPEFRAYVSLVLNISLQSLKQGQLQDALEDLQSFASRSDIKNQSSPADNTTNFPVCSEMLNEAEKLGPEAMQQVTEALFSGGYIEKGNFGLLDRIVRACLAREDTAGALQAMESCVEKYNKCPAFSELMRKLVMEEDAANLQKVVDLATRVLGEMEVLTYLVITLLECNKPKQAQKILQTPGIRPVNLILKSGCNRFVARNEIQALQQLIQITRGLFTVNRDELLLQLMRLHLAQKEPQKALAVLDIYEEEGFSPRDSTLRYLAKALQSHNVEVPFDVPEIPQNSGRGQSQQTRPPVTQAPPPAAAGPQTTLDDSILGLIDAGDTAGLLALRTQRISEGKPITDEELTAILKVCFSKKEFQTVNSLVDALCESKDYDTLLKLGQMSMPWQQKKHLFQQMSCTYIKNGQSQEWLQKFTSDPRFVKWMISDEVISLLAKTDQEGFQQVQAIILNGRKENKFALNDYLTYLISNGKMDEAKDIIKEDSDLQTRLPVSGMARQLSTKKDDSGLKNLISLVKDLGEDKLRVPYSHLIEMKVHQGDLSQAMQYYDEALSCGLDTSQLQVRVMLSLKELLTKQGQAVPAAMASVQPPPSLSNPDDTSDSSSSSSDEEDSRKVQR